MASRTVLMVMVDSLRHDEVRADTMPFLHALAQSGGCGSLAPSFGFEPDGAYFAGLSPEACDGGAQYWVQKGKRLFVYTRLLGWLHALPVAPWRRFVRKATRALAQWHAQLPLPRRMASPACIPYNQLARFTLSLSHGANDPAAWPGRSIFDTARGLGIAVHAHCFPQHKVRTPVVVERYLRLDRGQHGLAFLFFGDLDGVGHQHGPHSAQRVRSLRAIDQALGQVWAHARSQYAEVACTVFGDHGMAEVKGHIDLRPALQAAGLDPQVDTWFLDSTFARFWVADAQRRARVIQAMAGVPGLRHVTDEDRARWLIRWPHNRFGDLVFAVDDHLLLHPSFYADGQAPVGMHGYLPGCRDNESAYVVAGDGVPPHSGQTSADMRRVHATVLQLLGQPVPAAMPSLLPSLQPSLQHPLQPSLQP
jgi:hypothetical protein